MKKTLINTKNLCKTYKTDGLEFNAIRNVNVEIYEKDFTVIMGSSGSGKSTLLYLLSGLDEVTAGEVWFDGKRIDKLKEKTMSGLRRQSIGFVFQAINLVSDLTIFENVSIPGYLGSKNRKEVNAKALKLLGKIGLEKELHRFPSEVSGGQQQRCAIARALINSPQVIFADEPTGALNSANGENVLDILTELNESGQTIIMVTHDLKAACRANRILFLQDGRIEEELNLPKYEAEGFGDREMHIFTFLKEKGW
ncbi:MAG: ABC transporter ATP-binding protein [Bacillota bacterium]